MQLVEPEIVLDILVNNKYTNQPKYIREIEGTVASE